MGDKSTPPVRWYVGARNDALFIIDKKPHPAPMDYLLPGGDTNIIAKMANTDPEAGRHASLIARAASRDHLFGDLVEALDQVQWAGRDHFRCVDCGGSPATGHSDTCRVGIVLAKAKDQFHG